MIRNNRNDPVQYRKSSGVIRVLIPVILLCLVSLSCNFPLLVDRSSKDELGLAQSLEGIGIMHVEEVIQEGDTLIIEYESLAEESPEVMLGGWLNAFSAAFGEAPDWEVYILRTSLDGEPYLEIKTSRLDLEGLAADELFPDMFLDRLVITDLQPLPNRVRIALVDLGLDLLSVSQFRDTLTVEYYPGPKANQAELMEEWWSIFAAIAEENPTVETIQIRALMPDTSTFVVEGAVEDIQSFVNTEITAVEYLAGLEIEEIPVQVED